MKKICFVDFDMSVTGGVEQVTASLANELCNIYPTFVYAINRGGEPAYKLDDRVVFTEGLTGEKRLRGMIQGTFRPFIKFVKDNGIDVVILMGNYPALVASFTRFFTKAKYVYCDHGGLTNQWKQKDITAIRFWDALSSHKVIVLTEKTRKDYIAKFHTNPKKVRCIYNWIDDKVVAAKKAYDDNSRKILSVGRFGKEKGYDMLVEVAKAILPRHPDWQWHVFGTGETFEEIAAKTAEYGLDKQLILKGNVQDAYKLYSEYAFLVLPSYREGLPLVLLEASAVGLPMVSFDIETGPNEIIDEGRNGLLIPPYDLEEMKEKIEELMSNQDKRRRLAEYDGKKDKFSKKNILKEWIEVIEEL